jgi:large subunit ribosomal protein L25
MESPVLRVWRRDRAGKGVARKIRAKGLIPAIFYGGGENIALSLQPQELLKILSAGENTIFQLELDGDTGEDRKAIVRNLQRDPIKDVVLHADLYKISMDIELTVSVPIVIEGESQVVSDAGGIINQLLHEIQIQCLPSLIPHELTIDVSHLGLGDVLHVQDIQVPAGIRLLAEATEVVVSVSVPLPEEAGAATSSVEAETPASGLESEER